jgi:hypothetical protein
VLAGLAGMAFKNRDKVTALLRRRTSGPGAHGDQAA